MEEASGPEPYQFEQLDLEIPEGTCVAKPPEASDYIMRTVSGWQVGVTIFTFHPFILNIFAK